MNLTYMITMLDDIHKLYLSYAPFNKWLAEEELVVNGTYLCKAQDFHIGTWTGEYFSYVVISCGQVIRKKAYHYDNKLNKGTVKPLNIVD